MDSIWVVTAAWVEAIGAIAEVVGAGSVGARESAPGGGAKILRKPRLCGETSRPR
jgi:hypothetical protein